MLDLQMGAARFKLIIMYFKNQAGRLGRCLKYCREADVEFLKHYFDDTPLSEIDILELEHVFLYTPRYLMVVMTLGYTVWLVELGELLSRKIWRISNVVS